MKRWPLIISAWIMLFLLASCQYSAIPGAISVNEQHKLTQQTLKQIDQPTSQKMIYYFSRNGQYSNKPVADGYFRKVLGKTKTGGWVVQDFYQSSQTKQTTPFIIFHPDGLTNFDDDVIDGTVLWFRLDGSLSQSSTYHKGQIIGWEVLYDEHNTVRIALFNQNGTPTGEARFYDQHGRLQWKQTLNNDHQLVQTFWYDNGQKALEINGAHVAAWDRHNQPVPKEKIMSLVKKLSLLLYQWRD